MRHSGRTIRWAALLLAGAAYAQEPWGQIAPPTGGRNGFHIYGGTVSLGYTSADMTGSSVLPVATSGPVGMASAALGYTNTGERGATQITYSPTGVAWGVSPLRKTLVQSLSLETNHRLTPRLRGRVSLDALDTTLDQWLFLSTTAPADAPESALPEVLPAAAGSVYGGRLFVGTAETGLSYAYTPRLTLSVGASAYRMQARRDEEEIQTGRFLLPYTTGGQAGVSAMYSVSPRTEFGADADTQYVESRLRAFFVHEAALSVRRYLAPRWFLRVRGGAAVMRPNRRGTIVDRGPIPLASLITGYATGRHTWIGRYDRSAADPYGIGTGRSEAIAGAWMWQGPDGWSAYASGGRQGIPGAIFGQSGFWQSNGGVTRRLSQHLAVNFAGAYVNTPAAGNGFSARATLIWAAGRGFFTQTP